MRCIGCGREMLHAPEHTRLCPDCQEDLDQLGVVGGQGRNGHDVTVTAIAMLLAIAAGSILIAWILWRIA